MVVTGVGEAQCRVRKLLSVDIPVAVVEFDAEIDVIPEGRGNTLKVLRPGEGAHRKGPGVSKSSTMQPPRWADNLAWVRVPLIVGYVFSSPPRRNPWHFWDKPGLLWITMPTFHYTTTVNPDQIDILGHLNNASYLAIFEAARWAVLGENGTAWETLTAAGVAPVILSVNLQFRREVRVGETLKIESTFQATSPQRFTVHQRMLGADGGLRASAEIQSAFLDVSTRKLAVPSLELLAGLGADPHSVPPHPVVQGLGGAFLYANDAIALAAWYTLHFGLTMQDWGQAWGLEFPSVDRVPSGRQASTVFALFQAKEPLPETRTGRINFRVRDLDGLRARLEAAGVRVEVGPQDFGRFLWAWDPEGNRIELWEPQRAE